MPIKPKYYMGLVEEPERSICKCGLLIPPGEYREHMDDGTAICMKCLDMKFAG